MHAARPAASVLHKSFTRLPEAAKFPTASESTLVRSNLFNPALYLGLNRRHYCRAISDGTLSSRITPLRFVARDLR
jgi:hypothetical protein